MYSKLFFYMSWDFIVMCFKFIPTMLKRSQDLHPHIFILHSSHPCETSCKAPESVDRSTCCTIRHHLNSVYLRMQNIHLSQWHQANSVFYNTWKVTNITYTNK